MTSLLLWVAFAAAPWQQGVRYWIHATLDDSLNTIIGHEDVMYVNNSPDTLSFIWFHLYPNAFRPNSVYFREREELLGDYSWRSADDSDFGRIDVLNVVFDEDTVRDISVNDTEMKVPFHASLAPGDTAHISMDFVVKIPKVWERFGHEGHHYAITQWYPKVVVYDETGWHPDGYHLMGEFYGEFAHYDVSFTLPVRYVIGSTGRIIAPSSYIERLDSIMSGVEVDTTASPMVNVHLVADSVHDFAIVAAPDYKIHRQSCGSTEVLTMYYRDLSLFSTVPNFVCTVLDSYQRWYGPYPYGELTVAQAPHKNAMEYPKLVIIPPSIGKGNPSVKRLNKFKETVAHEIAHQWFYGVLANNEMAESWLDEGFATFTQVRFMRTVDTIPKKRPPIDALLIHGVMGTPFDKPILGTKPYTGQIYWINSYIKGRRIPSMVRWIVGDTIFDFIMHTYYRNYAFKHIRSSDFQHVVEEVTGYNWDWFFNPWLRTTTYPDFSFRKQGDGRITLNVEGPVMPVPIGCGDSSLRAERGQQTVTLPPECRPVLDPKDIFVETDETNNGKRPRIGFLLPGFDYMRDDWVIVPMPSIKMPGVSILNLKYQDLRGTLLSALYDVDKRRAFLFGSSMSLKPGIWNTAWRFDGYPPEALTADIGIFKLSSKHLVATSGHIDRTGIRVVRVTNADINIVGDQYSDGTSNSTTPYYLVTGIYYSGGWWHKYPYFSLNSGGHIELNYSFRDHSGPYARLTFSAMLSLARPLNISLEGESEFVVGKDVPRFDMASVGGHRIYRFSWTQGPALPGYYRHQLFGKSMVDVKASVHPVSGISLYAAAAWLDFQPHLYREFGIKISIPIGNAAPALYFPLWISDPLEGERNWGLRAVFVVYQ